MKGSDDVRKILSVMVGALLLATTATPAHSDGGMTPIRLSDGKIRYDITMLQVDYSHKLVVDNGSTDVIRVEYSDPTYGHQVAIVTPGYMENPPVMCADAAYAASSLLTVTFAPGTPYETVGTGAYFQVTSMEPVRAKIAVTDVRKKLDNAKAKFKLLKKKLERARSLGYKVRTKRLVRKVRFAKARVVRTRAAYYTAKDAYDEVMSEADYCTARRVS